MLRTEARQGVRMMKFLDILGRYEAAEFSQFEAAELLWIGKRTFRRWRQRRAGDGEAGLLDRLALRLDTLLTERKSWAGHWGPLFAAGASCGTVSLPRRGKVNRCASARRCSMR